MIPYGRQSINQSDIDAVIDALRSDYLTQGPAVPAFEEAVASLCGVANAVAVNSSTSALHLACLALGVGKGDIVWTSPNTFVASANCARYCGAEVDFVDIDPKTYNMSVEFLTEKLVDAKKEGRLPKVVIPVHMCGQSCDMARIHELGQTYGFKVIEDASHGIGGRYQGTPIGTCRFSEITVFSFHPVKIVTTGEGGMALTNDPTLARAMRQLRSHGITREADEMTHPPDGPWYYQQLALGFNYRMTDIQAALGTSQIKRLEEFVAARTALARRYDSLLFGLPLSIPWQHPDTGSAWHLYVIRLNLAAIEDTHAEVFQKLREAGIGVNLHYIPVHLQPYYRALGFHEGYCPEAERYYAEAISLPMFPELSTDDQDTVVANLRLLLAG